MLYRLSLPGTPLTTSLLEKTYELKWCGWVWGTVRAELTDHADNAGTSNSGFLSTVSRGIVLGFIFTLKRKKQVACTSHIMDMKYIPAVQNILYFQFFQFSWRVPAILEGTVIHEEIEIKIITGKTTHLLPFPTSTFFGSDVYCHVYWISHHISIKTRGGQYLTNCATLPYLSIILGVFILYYSITEIEYLNSFFFYYISNHFPPNSLHWYLGLK